MAKKFEKNLLKVTDDGKVIFNKTDLTATEGVKKIFYSDVYKIFGKSTHLTTYKPGTGDNCYTETMFNEKNPMLCSFPASLKISDHWGRRAMLGINDLIEFEDKKCYFTDEQHGTRSGFYIDYKHRTSIEVYENRRSGLTPDFAKKHFTIRHYNEKGGLVYKKGYIVKPITDSHTLVSIRCGDYKKLNSKYLIHLMNTAKTDDEKEFFMFADEALLYNESYFTHGEIGIIKEKKIEYLYGEQEDISSPAGSMSLLRSVNVYRLHHINLDRYVEKYSSYHNYPYKYSIHSLVVVDGEEKDILEYRKIMKSKKKREYAINSYSRIRQNRMDNYPLLEDDYAIITKENYKVDPSIIDRMSLKSSDAINEEVNKDLREKFNIFSTTKMLGFDDATKSSIIEAYLKPDKKKQHDVTLRLRLDYGDNASLEIFFHDAVSYATVGEIRKYLTDLSRMAVVAGKKVDRIILTSSFNGEVGFSLVNGKYQVDRMLYMNDFGEFLQYHNKLEVRDDYVKYHFIELIENHKYSNESVSFIDKGIASSLMDDYLDEIYKLMFNCSSWERQHCLGIILDAFQNVIK